MLLVGKYISVISFVVFLLPLWGGEELDLSLLEEALTKRDKHGSVLTDVVQRKTLPSLSDPLVTKGRLWLLPQKAFRWEQGSPVTDIAICSKGDVFLLNEKDKTVEKHDDGDRAVRPLMLLLGMGKDSTFKGLLSNFEAVETDQTSSTLTVTFLPESGLMKRAVSKLTLTLNLKTSFPSEIMWEQKDGAIITTTFKKPKLNVSMDEDLFMFPPEEYTVKD